MNQYVIVQINAGRQYRLVFEAWDGRNIVEVKTENKKSCDESNGLNNPHAFYFADTVEQAKTVAASLAYWNPGTHWQWFKTGGVVVCRKPGDKPDVKEITEKGYLPKDI